MTDRDVLEAVSSAEADSITPLMSKIYNRLKLANQDGYCQESDCRLYFSGEEREGKWITAWEQLCRWLRVSSATAHKAISWMHEQGIIGYYAGKNGAGIRIFLNRAASSIAIRAPQTGQKNLPENHTSSVSQATSSSEAAFKDNLTVDSDASENSYPRAPKNGAEEKTSGNSTDISPTPRKMASVDELVNQIISSLEPKIEAAARRASSTELERTLHWFERTGLPKAARVAQSEAYKVLRHHGLREVRRQNSAGSDVGRSHYEAVAPHKLTEGEIRELAEHCLAQLEARGQSVDVTLSDLSSEAGGGLLPEDAPRVRIMVESIMAQQTGKEDEER